MTAKIENRILKLFKKHGEQGNWGKRFKVSDLIAQVNKNNEKKEILKAVNNLIEKKWIRTATTRMIGAREEVSILSKSVYIIDEGINQVL